MTAGRHNHRSLSQNWCTPPKYVDAIREFFGGSVGLDPCSNEHSLVGADVAWQLPDTDGLSLPWAAATVFVNPPYGQDRDRGTGIRDWLRKCCEAREQHRAEVLALVPVATNTRHWKESVFGVASAVAFLYDTRLRFWENGRQGAKGAPMSCAMVYWGDRCARFEEVFMDFGAVVDLRRLQGRMIGNGAGSAKTAGALDLGYAP